jgi:hypothetical protein
VVSYLLHHGADVNMKNNVSTQLLVGWQRWLRWLVVVVRYGIVVVSVMFHFTMRICEVK